MRSVLKSNRRGGTRRRMAVGGGLVLAVGVLIGMFGKLPGLGSGADSGSPESEPDVDPGNVVSTTSGGVLIGTPRDNGKSSGPGGEVVTVVIDSRSYLVLEETDNERNYRTTDLEDVVRLAKDASGNEDGVQVRVLLRDSSRASAEDALQSALLKAGLSEDAIYWQKGTQQAP